MWGLSESYRKFRRQSSIKLKTNMKIILFGPFSVKWKLSQSTNFSIISICGSQMSLIWLKLKSTLKSTLKWKLNHELFLQNFIQTNAGTNVLLLHELERTTKFSFMQSRKKSLKAWRERWIHRWLISVILAKLHHMPWSAYFEKSRSFIQSSLIYLSGAIN